jgi:hypothetical protein
MVMVMVMVMVTVLILNLLAGMTAVCARSETLQFLEWQTCFNHRTLKTLNECT